MLRKVLGVISGYVFTAIFVLGTFALLYWVLGADGVYKPGSYEVSTTWVVATLVLGFVAALGGGWLCYVISKSHGAVAVFAGIVLFLGLAFAILQASSDRLIHVREGPITNADAMRKSIQPLWVSIFNPVLGAMGILIGGRLKNEE